MSTAATMRHEMRPLGEWLEPKTTARRGSHLFRAKWSDTLELLDRETGQLGAELVVIQIDVTEVDLRRDGMLRANAQVGFPGVRVSFDSRHGPLTYATDMYEQQYGAMPGWQANVRAIALSLEALRAVDRYGVTHRGEQYTGWKAISDRPEVMTRQSAAELIAHWAASEMTGLTAQFLLTQPAVLKSAYRAAAKATHPDRTGDADTFARINAARDLLLRDDPAR